MLEALVAPAAQGIVRALLFAGIMVVVGGWCFALRVVPVFDRDERGSAQVRARASRTLLLAVGALAMLFAWRLVQQAAAFADTPSAWATEAPRVITQTTWGTGWLLQGAALLLVALAAPGALGGNTRGTWTLGAGALALAATPALAGHPVGAPRLAPLAVALDAMHVTAAGAWLGTLFIIVVAALPVARGTTTGLATELLARFSSLALASGGVVALTGLFASWLHLESLSALWSSDYGLALVRKLVVLVGVAALGGYNWRVVTPRVRATGDLAALRRSAVAELTLAAILVALTAVLVATPLPAEM